MWLVIINVAYFLNALSAVVDKFLLNKKIPQPAVYTFAIITLGLLGLVLAPWGFAWISGFLFLISLIAGVSFSGALFSLFKALTYNETSRITPLIGGLSPIFVFSFSFFILAERLSARQFLAFIFIVLGTLLISYSKHASHGEKKGYLWAFFSACLFGFSYALTKYIFDNTTFINGFVWLRVTTFLGGALLLLSRANRQAIFQSFKKNKGSTSGLFLVGQISGSASFLLINYAISLASVTLVNALQGVQYVFLLIMVLILSRRHSNVLEEKMRGVVLAQKIIATALIGLGLGFLI